MKLERCLNLSVVMEGVLKNDHKTTAMGEQVKFFFLKQ